jgi:hypothetical protein
LTCLLPGLLFGAAGLVGPLARAAARGHWLLLSCGVTAGQKGLALTLALLPPALALGGAAGVLSAPSLSGVTWSSMLALALLGMLASACAVLVAATVGRRAIAGKGSDATALLIRMAVTGGLLMLATWRFHVPGLLVTTALAAGLSGRSGTAREDTVRAGRIARQGAE